MGLLTRFPILVWAGAALLGWIAGELLFEEPILHHFFEEGARALSISHDQMEKVAAAVGAAIVVMLGWIMTRGHKEETVGH